MKHTLRSFACIITLTSGLILAGCATTSAVAPPPSLLEQIEGQERNGLKALKTGDLAVFAHSTADEAIFIDPHGLAGKAEVMKNVAGFKLIDFSMNDVKLLPLSGNSGLITYTLTEKGTSHGHGFTVKVYVSSLWTYRNGTWLCLFSQETAAK
jgi:Domain of unknown function (DUF4440)